MKDSPIHVEQLMTKDVKTCRSADRLDAAAKLMWDHDCGCTPVQDETGAVVGMLTDRDICMAAYTQNRAIAEIAVGDVMTRDLCTCEAADTVETAEEIMRAHQVHRLPVLGDDGRLVGLLSITDLACAVGAFPHEKGICLDATSIEVTLAAISRSRDFFAQDDIY